MQWSRRSAAVLGPTGAVPPGGTAGARDVGNVGTENTPVGSHPIWGALIRLVVDRPDSMASSGHDIYILVGSRT